MPHITATLTKKSIKMSGADGLRPGRVKLGRQGLGTRGVRHVRRAATTLADFVADINKFGAKNDIKALKHALANAQILGGVGRRRLRHHRPSEGGLLHTVLPR